MRYTSYEGTNVVDVALEVVHWIPLLVVLSAHYTLTMNITCRKRNTQQIAAKRKEDGRGTPCPLRSHEVQSRVIGSECRVPILRCSTEPCHTPRSRDTSSPRSEGRYSPCLLPLEKRILIIIKKEAIQTISHIPSLFSFNNHNFFPLIHVTPLYRRKTASALKIMFCFTNQIPFSLSDEIISSYPLLQTWLKRERMKSSSQS